VRGSYLSRFRDDLPIILPGSGLPTQNGSLSRLSQDIVKRDCVISNQNELLETSDVFYPMAAGKLLEQYNVYGVADFQRYIVASN